ncbi:fuzzy -like protein, partial [Brachionus plicatilis]
MTKIVDTSMPIGNLICLKSTDGVPLFTRNFNNSQELPFQIIGTLNSIFTIGDKYGIRIDSLDSTKFKIIWKMYHSNLTLILIEPIEPFDEGLYLRKLDMLFEAMVMMYGLEDLKNIENIEKFKKEIKIVFPVIDLILNSCSNNDLFGGYLTNSIELVLDFYESQDITEYQTTLEKSCEKMETAYACVFINGRIVAASSFWWELTPVESTLISLLCMTFNNTTCSDTPVNLTSKNPTEPLRLLSFNLISNVILCFIFSEKPHVHKAKEIVESLWHPMFPSLVNLKLSLPRNLGKNTSVDQNMIAFLLINKKTGICASSLCPNEKTISEIPLDLKQNRYKLLKYCYLNLSTMFFREKGDSSCKFSEAYSLILDHKCYAFNDLYFQFYALYNKSIPTYAL